MFHLHGETCTANESKLGHAKEINKRVDIFAMHKSWIGVTVLLFLSFFGWIENPSIFLCTLHNQGKRKGVKPSNLNIKEIRQKDVELSERRHLL